MEDDLICPLCDRAVGFCGLLYHLAIEHHVRVQCRSGCIDYGFWCPCGSVFQYREVRNAHFARHGRECVLTAMLGGVV